MDTVRVSQIAKPSGSSVALGRSRYGAAVVAIAFPVVSFATLIAGLLLRGSTSLLTHTGLVVTLPAGLVAMVIWCRRYWKPALIAFRNPVPISLEEDTLRVNGKAFKVTESLRLESDPSVLAVMDGNQQIATFPGYFIRLRQLP